MVSVIIPTYNEEKVLPLCLDSILNLNYPKEFVEVIVVDNGSKDRTREIAMSFGAKVLCDNSKNVSGLRNKGAKYSKGEILAFVDADCIVSREWLKNASKYFDETDVVVWGSPPGIPKNPTWVQQTWFLIRQKETQVQNVEWLETMNLFVRKYQFLSVDGFNETLVTCEDVDFCYRIGKYGEIVSDTRIEVIHMGEAKTVKEFMKKEIWRGGSNLSGIRSHGLTVKEIPSLAIPIYFGLFLPIMLLVFIVFMDSVWIITFLIFYLFPSLAVLFKMRRKKIGLVNMTKLLLLLQVYFLSRTVAVTKNF